MAWMERAGVTKRRLRARKKYEESSEENETIKNSWIREGLGQIEEKSNCPSLRTCVIKDSKSLFFKL